MFGKKKREQQEEANRRATEARKKADEAEREAREAEEAAGAFAKQEKRSLFSRFKKQKTESVAPAEEVPEEETVAPPPVRETAPAQPFEPIPAPVPAAAAQPAPKQSRRARKREEKEEQKKDVRIKELESELKRAEKKSKSARFCDFFAFIVLLAAALLMLLGPVLKLILEKTGGVEALTTVSTVAQYCLLAAIAIPAWYFVYRKSIGWKIVFFLALAGFIVGNILGLTL